MAADLSRWRSWWNAVGARGDAAVVYEALATAYGQRHRRYHTLGHIGACLHEFDGMRYQCRDAFALEMAIWFHDAVYLPRKSDNEQQSARWAQRVCQEAGLPTTFDTTVTRLIGATSHATAPADDIDVRVLIDIDLSILGRPTEEFDAYEEGVHFEYRWVPGPIFRRKRVEILQKFLARVAIYSTAPMRDRYESTARANLIRSIERLRIGGDA